MIAGYIDLSKAGSSDIRLPKTDLIRETKEIIEFIGE
jgi:hypothetical protein